MENRRLSNVSVLLMMIVMLMMGPAYVQAQKVGRWEKLGERTVNLFLDKDVIRCSHKGTFTTIRFHVDKAPVSFLKVMVKYGNGAIDNLNFNQLVPAGANSRYLDLRGNKREIREITIYYKSEPRRPGIHSRYKKAKVQVWGRH